MLWILCFPSAFPAMQSTTRLSIPYLTDLAVRSKGSSSVCTVRILPQPSPTRKLFLVPTCTQDPHRLRQIILLSSVAFSFALPFCPVPSKRESCTSSTDRTPRHGDHDVRSHGLDQGNGTVDGLGPAVRLLV